MIAKLNCWEYKNCGREKGGLLENLLGECPVSTAMKHDGQNGGKGAGRVCWMVSSEEGVMPCGRQSCCACDFYNRVVYEEEESACHQYASLNSESINRLKILTSIPAND